MELKRPKKSFPFKKIEKLIEMATKYSLEFLEVDGIKIVPKKNYTLSSTNLETEAGKLQPKFTRQQQENIILFGQPDLDS